jgi:L-lactate dehydrogenase complex protein LldG
MLRQTMLTRISAALGRAGSTVEPEPLPAFSFGAPWGAGGDLEEFCRELERVGGRVRRVRSRAEILAGVEELLAREAGGPVAVSDGRLLHELGVRGRVEASGREVIPAFKEYAAGRKDGSMWGLSESYKRELLGARVGITSADYGIADTGTVVLVSTAEQHRLTSLVPPVHVCVLDAGRVAGSLPELLARVEADSDECWPPPAMTFITGPSRTADIEHTITLGVHGPNALHLFLYERTPEREF